MEITLDPDRTGPAGLDEHQPRKLSALQWSAIALGAFALAFLIYGSMTGEHGGGHDAHAGL